MQVTPGSSSQCLAQDTHIAGTVYCSTNYEEPSTTRPGAQRTASESPHFDSASAHNGFVFRTHGLGPGGSSQLTFPPSLPAQLSIEVLDLSIITSSATSLSPSL